MSSSLAGHINTLARFCGMRDLDRPDRAALRERCGIDRADVMVLFGGSILAGGDLLARAIRDGLARTTIIVGGEGSTTEALRQRVHRECPQIETAGLPEAEVFQRYLREVHGCEADFLETKSTNCGNNITNLLALLEAERIPCGSIILCQDATMQRRMDAGLRRYAPEGLRIINYAAYAAEVRPAGGGLAFAEDIHGMWDMARYIHLLMGEIPRLTDDANGYGPNGRGFIAHVDIPEAVAHAFEALKAAYGGDVRVADPRYASGQAETLPSK